MHYHHQIETGSAGDHAAAKATRRYVEQIKELEHRRHGVIDKKVASKREHLVVATKHVDLQQ